MPTDNDQTIIHTLMILSRKLTKLNDTIAELVNQALASHSIAKLIAAGASGSRKIQLCTYVLI